MINRAHDENTRLDEAILIMAILLPINIETDDDNCIHNASKKSVRTYLLACRSHETPLSPLTHDHTL